jgi:hypothetical protein
LQHAVDKIEGLGLGPDLDNVGDGAVLGDSSLLHVNSEVTRGVCSSQKLTVWIGVLCESSKLLGAYLLSVHTVGQLLCVCFHAYICESTRHAYVRFGWLIILGVYRGESNVGSAR